jgi:hypothetical protein
MDYFFKYISKQLMIKLIGISYNKRCAWKVLIQFGASGFIAILRRGSVGIRLNDDIRRYFHTKKGLRQGTLYPLFVLILWLTCSLLWLRESKARR